MKVTIKGKIMTIEIELKDAEKSSSGKTMLVCSETQKAVATVDGKPLTVGVNAYYKP